jgi:hypothetical protein
MESNDSHSSQIQPDPRITESTDTGTNADADTDTDTSSTTLLTLQIYIPLMRQAQEVISFIPFYSLYVITFCVPESDFDAGC